MLKSKRGGALLLGILWSACSGGCSSPTTPTQSPTPSPFATLIGNYTLTLEIDEACAIVPQSERVRRYDAVVVGDVVGGGYRPIVVVGGGFKETTSMGELFSDGNSTFRLRWNFSDIGCAGGGDKAEPLADGRQLYICAEGPATVSDSTISAAIAGSASFMGGGYCTGSHQFTFVRHAQ